VTDKINIVQAALNFPTTKLFTHKTTIYKTNKNVNKNMILFKEKIIRNVSLYIVVALCC